MTSRQTRAITSFFVPPLTAAVLLYQVLANLQIGFTSSETLVVIGVVLGAAAAAGVLAAAGGAWIRAAVFAVSALLLLDAAGVLPYAPGVLTMAVVAVVFWHLRERIHSILLVFLAVILAATIVTQPRPRVLASETRTGGANALVESWAARGPFDEALPNLLHIVFDEMMSPGAIGDDLPGGAETRQALYDLGERHALRTHDSVYTRDFFTGNTLPGLMASDYLGRARADAHPEGTNPAGNAYFDDMAARGYRTIVFQTSHIDFCADASVVACETFNSYDPGGDGYDGLDLRSRTLNLWSTLLKAYEPSYVSTYGGLLLRKHYELGGREVGVVGEQPRFDVQRFPDWFDRFAAFAARAPRGTHIFAHFMVPHAPYLLTSDCTVSGTFYAGYYLGRHYEAEADRERARLSAYSDYLTQLNCVGRYLDDLLSTIGRVEAFRDATIIVHGDHGSRISVGNVIEDYSHRDFIDNYATYYAIKGPGVEPGIDCELISLPEIFRRHMTGGSPPGPGSPSPLPVIVSSREREGATVRVPMPEFGCAADGN